MSVPEVDRVERKFAQHLPVVEFDNTEAETKRGGYTINGVKVRCPYPDCRTQGAPLRRRSTRKLAAGWEWVGVAYQQPFEDWLCTCRGCGRRYRLHTYSPQ